ncbi:MULTISPECIES: hypothetical protein [unclassified Sporolactobacillus]|uniref:hypothetical protein n=1 Tax=unclassified Sporolactobacillus TaxID=2628533 RepID=UPI002367914B|nr:hypothetical protein [Sporolactobacillus sp. CQH2019]MDD9149207.1 hypothetical protein [Sporolactobacillus sp. CQH2019]
MEEQEQEYKEKLPIGSEQLRSFYGLSYKELFNELVAFHMIDETGRPTELAIQNGWMNLIEIGQGSSDSSI